MKEPMIEVGVLLCQPQIKFRIDSPYTFNRQPLAIGEYSITVSGEHLLFENERYNSILLEADNIHNQSFELLDVIIGVNFHWERKENQRFLGNLKVIEENGAITAINLVSLEDYLTSVISSEMSATSSLELLKAHAVISRSWLLAQIDKTKFISEKNSQYESSIITPTEIYRWYDREDHDNFDVCADDHCQRYQGITRQSTPLVKEVISQTKGEVLLYGEKICDARFSKCCGGMMETFENVWEPVNHPYLQAKLDRLNQEQDSIDLTVENQAEQWIRTTPEAFCHTTDKQVLNQVLNDYDQETSDFYRWQVVYTQEQLRALILKKTGIDFGDIIGFEPIERGKSGRLIRLKIIGTHRVMTIGKELEIRRTLSESHLYSSAFVIDTDELDDNGIPQHFTIVGAGWGHGVGLCQIGAAMMAEKGHSYQEILQHYFPTSTLNKLYE